VEDKRLIATSATAAAATSAAVVPATIVHHQNVWRFGHNSLRLC
jgi:hypothetical protein